MSQQTVHTRVNADAVAREIGEIPRLVKSSGSAGKKVMQACAEALLEKIREAFVIKSKGGTDEAGERWVPLKPATVAYGRSKRTRAEQGRSVRPSQALTSKQQDRWWAEYRKGLAIYKGDKGSAAKRAWFVLKSQGARTLYEKYSDRKVNILRDSDRLYKSLTVDMPGNVSRTSPGSIDVGSDVPYAAAHHSGVKGKLPQRRLWPPVNRWPASWWQAIVRAAQKAIKDLAVNQAAGAR